MREIKFRGKRIDNGEWAYGYVWLNQRNQHFIDVKGGGYEVDRETVGQFIGVHDDHDEKMYEGSIIKMFTTEWIVAEVKIEFGIPILCSDDFADSFEHVSEYLQFDGTYGWIDCVVIGNIHNSELLVQE